jgi:hypothetical protein
VAPITNGWQGPTTYQPTAPQAATANQAAPSNGQLAQSNVQTYQSFSAPPSPAYSPPSPAYSYGLTPTYSAPSYPTYGGYGYYGGPSYYGGSYGYSPGWRSLDTANHHGTSF